MKHVAVRTYQGFIFAFAILNLSWIVLPIFAGYMSWNGLELFGYSLATIIILFLSLFSEIFNGNRNFLKITLLTTAAGFLKFLILPHHILMF